MMKRQAIVLLLLLTLWLVSAVPAPIQLSAPLPEGLTAAEWAQIQSHLAPEAITAWNQQTKLNAGDAATDDQFGRSVAVSGDTAVIGAWRDNDGGTNSGSAYVFTRSGEVWSQQAKLTASDPAAFDRFGSSVAISGDTAVIGAYSDGSAYVFSRSGGVWSQQAKLTASDDAGNFFGWSVAVDGDTVVIGAYLADYRGSSSGSAYVFTRSGGVWSQQAKLTPSDLAAGDEFGISVVVSGDTAVIGAHGNDDGGSNSGSAYVFSRSGGGWSQQAKLTASDHAADDRFGRSVAISGDTAVIGAFLDDDGGTDSGSAYVFALNEYTLTVDMAGDGSGQVQSDPPGTTFMHGSVVTLTATAEIGSTFAGWSGDIVTTTNPITLTMDSDKFITATFTLNQYELNVATVGNGTAAPNSGTYDYGTVVTVTATADIGSTFLDWSGDVVTTTNPITVTMDSDKFITAKFTLNQYELNVATVGNGTAAPNSGTYDYGTVVTLTATADLGSTFLDWSGDLISTTNPVTVTMDSDKFITATFSLNQYELNVATVGTGTAAPNSGTYDYGTVVTLTATADLGSTFIDWSGDVISTSNPITVTMDSDKAITATFALNQYQLTTFTDGNGSGTVSPSNGTYDHGTIITVTATANFGSSFTGWSGDVITTTNPVTVTMDSDNVITATFAFNEYAIAISAEPSVGGVVTGGGMMTYGALVTVTAVANTGYTFVKWTEGGEDVSALAEYSFQVRGERTLVAHFTPVTVLPNLTIYLPFIMRP